MSKHFIIAVAVSLIVAEAASAQYEDWRYAGSLYLDTTPHGANLPEAAVERDFPLLIRLDQGWFNFSQASSAGEDIRFSDESGKPLAYQIEDWDPAAGRAAIWVRVPQIRGNATQELKMHWGKADATSESDGAAVFNQSNGYISVQHLNVSAKDEVGTIDAEEKGAQPSKGIIARGRHFADTAGISCGDKIEGFPTGSAPHSSQAWIRPTRSNGTVLAWGNEQRSGKVVMSYRSPPHISMDCYFSGGNVKGESRIPMDQWTHVVHTYQPGDSRIYINGILDGRNQMPQSPMAIEQPAKMWIGGWYNHYTFNGDIDEVRISRVVRSADWVKLEYENQRPEQTLIGMLVQPGMDFSVSPGKVALVEGTRIVVTAKANGARKIYWTVDRDGQRTVVAVDRFDFTFDAGRVQGDTSLAIELKAVYPDQVKTLEIPVTVTEAIPEPAFTLPSPSKWDGRETIEILPQITNLPQMQAAGAGQLTYEWNVSGLAVIKEIVPGKLILHRAQNSGPLVVTATISNGGPLVSSSATISVQEPQRDAWVRRTPDKDEKPQDNQFYARDENNEGTLYCNGQLEQDADSLFLRLYADNKLAATLTQQPTDDNRYAFAVKLKPGLIKYRVELGCGKDGTETVLHTADDIVCGDAYIIEGQSNALATDTREESPRESSEWIRSYGYPQDLRIGESENLWCNPVWKFERGESHAASRRQHKAELGWWGMELAKRLVESQKIPICVINGAAGGTRIDQHQRNPENPEDVSTIYGRLLWRVRQARLTHGIRAVLWHQGESDQGAAGPDGGYGWETYQQYFVDMSAAWKQDFPNIQRYYIFQIWPNACSMGGGNGDMMREKQRTLPQLYSNMGIMSTLGIEPPGSCHYPLTGWSRFAHLIQPQIERDLYGKEFTASVTPPDLKQAYFTNDAKDEIVLRFDQPVVWADSLAGEFYLDHAKDQVAAGTVSGNLLTLKLKQASNAKRITYLKETSWSQERLLRGKNGIAALTFCEVPIGPFGSGR